MNDATQTESPPAPAKLCWMCDGKKQVRRRPGFATGGEGGKVPAQRWNLASLGTPAGERFGDVIPCPECQPPAAVVAVADPLENDPDGLTRGQLMWLKGVGQNPPLISRINPALLMLERQGLIEKGDVCWRTTEAGRAKIGRIGQNPAA
jgi:hypothetical protein